MVVELAYMLIKHCKQITSSQQYNASQAARLDLAWLAVLTLEQRGVQKLHGCTPLGFSID